MANENLYPFDGYFINKPAVYVILNAEKQVIYIGETQDLGRRIADHRADVTHLMHKYNPVWVALEFGCDDETFRKSRERALILEYDPPCNRR